jgi:hypothetical protein
MQRNGHTEIRSIPTTSPTNSRASDTTNSSLRPDRPCDACRRRKSRCVLNTESTACVLCKFHRQTCTFNEEPAPRKRKAPTPSTNNASEAPDRSKRPYVRLWGPRKLATNILLGRQSKCPVDSRKISSAPALSSTTTPISKANRY